MAAQNAELTVKSKTKQYHLEQNQGIDLALFIFNNIYLSLKFLTVNASVNFRFEYIG